MTELTNHSRGSLLGARSDQARAAKGLTATNVLWLLLLFDSVILFIPSLLMVTGVPFESIEYAFAPEFENSVPAWYSSVKFLLFALLLVALSISVPTTHGRRRAMVGAALLFVLMSCDESAGLHERLQRGLDNQFFSRVADRSVDSEVFAKVLVGMTGLAIATFAVVIVVRALQGIENGKRACAAGFLLLAIGAVGVDLGKEFLPGRDDATSISSIIEEAFELSGVSLMIFGALQALARAPLTLYLGPRLAAERGTMPASDDERPTSPSRKP